MNRDRSSARHVVVLAHPDPRSFNATIANTYCQTVRECGQEAILRDLYAIGFDPVLKDSERPGTQRFALSRDVQDELAVIDGGDVFAIVYPIWFGMPPAMMKGYIDRVLGAGVTHREIQDRAGQGVLRNKRIVSITTSGTREVWLDEQAQIESLKNVLGRYLSKAFGAKSVEHLQFGGITEGFAARFIDQNLQDVKDRARKVCANVAAEAAHAA
jgi:NAD(P)H dehydrogenase (quinone)